MNDQSGVALRFDRVGLVVVNAVAVEGHRGITE